jgi:hypothetical protein
LFRIIAIEKRREATVKRRLESRSNEFLGLYQWGRLRLRARSVGFPEIAAMTNEDGYYQIRSIPPGTFTLGVHDEEGERLGQKTFRVERGKISKVDITLQGFLVSDT